MRTLPVAVAAVVSSGAGCAATPAPAPAPLAPPTLNAAFDYAGMFGHHHSLSLYDESGLTREALSRLLIEPELLDLRVEDAPIEPWTRRLLLSRLGQAGVIIVGPPLAPEADPRGPCPPGACVDPPPTVALRAVSFQSGEDTVPVVVQAAEGGGYDVAVRAVKDQASLCGEDMTLRVGYAEFSAVLQRLSDGALLATMHEVALLPGWGETRAEAPLPDPAVDVEGFCVGVAEIWDRTPELARTEERYQSAGEAAMEQGLVQVLRYAAEQDAPTE